jgi:hypothetical protein
MPTKFHINSILLIVILTIATLISFKTNAQTITTNSLIVNSFCAGETVNISYVINGSFNPSNIFAVQLSDTNGNFISPINIGQITSTSSGNILCTLPIDCSTSYLYKVRVLANDPFIVGTDNGANININARPFVEAGTNQTVCANSIINLNGTVNDVAPYINWSTSGSGSFVNSSNLNAVYTPSIADISNGSVVLKITTNDPAGPCVPASDSMTVFFLPRPIVGAGVNQNLCNNITLVNLNGSIGGSATSASWRSLGTGIFINPTNLNTNYIPSNNDILNGFVELILTTDDPIGPCSFVADTVEIYFNPLAISNAGVDQRICKNDFLYLNANTSATTGSKIWTTNGTGYFSNNTLVNPVYYPSNSDLLLGKLMFTFTTINPNYICDNTIDSMEVTIDSLAIANAGNDIGICKTTTFAALNGQISGSATTASWSTSGTGTFDNVNVLNTNYYPSVFDKNNGFIYLILTTNDPFGPCSFGLDSLKIIFENPAQIDAGPDQVICENDLVNLKGSFNNIVSFASWTVSNEPAYISFDTVTTYMPNQIDLSNNFFYVKYKSDDPAGDCKSVSDSILITINSLATVSAGADQTICTSESSIILNSAIGGAATSAIWKTTGTGYFSDSTILNPRYFPSTADKQLGSIKLILGTNNPVGPCESAFDTIQLSFNLSAVSNIINDTSICENDLIYLNASTNYISGNAVWYTNGSGVFNNNLSLTPIYFPSENDKTLGQVTFTFITNDSFNSCSNSIDSTKIDISKMTIANAGLDQTICNSNNSILLIGSINGSATSAKWTSTGSGSFNNSDSLVTIYTFSNSDKQSGLVKLILTTNDPLGPCSSVIDTLNVILYQKPIVNAGQNQSICGNSPINLNGSYNSAAVFARWLSSNSINYISFDSVTTYYPTQTDINLGKITFTLISSDPVGPCREAKDSITVSLFKPAFADAGLDQTVCATNNRIDLIGNISGTATGLDWSTINGKGTFDKIDTIRTIYRPTTIDFANKLVSIVLSTNDPFGPCQVAKDTMDIFFKDSLVNFEVETVNNTCDSSIVAFINTTSSSGNTFVWNFGDSTATSTLANPRHIYKKTGLFNVKLVASNDVGCTEVLYKNTVLNNIRPKADFEVNYLNQCFLNNAFELNNTSNGGAESWVVGNEWSFGDNTFSTATFPTTKNFGSPGKYFIKLKVIAANNCTDTLVKAVSVTSGPTKPSISLVSSNTLKASNGQAYQWYFNGSPITGANLQTFQPTNFGFYSVRIDSSNGCGTLSDEFEFKYTSISGINSNTKISIYPNPTAGVFNIDSELQLEYIVYDFSGKEVLIGHKNSTIESIDLGEFKSGFYFIKLISKNETFTAKILKE